MLDRFLEQVSYSFESYDDCLLIDAVEMIDRSLKIKVRLHFDDTQDNYIEKYEDWEIACSGIREHNLCLENDYLSFDFCNENTDHILKWPYIWPLCLVSFNGKAENAYEVIGKLYNAHTALGNEWIPFYKYLNMRDSFESLISGGHGLLATAPEPFAKAYVQVLQDCGFNASISSSHFRSYWNGVEHVKKNVPLQVMIFGNGFVVAEKISAQKI